MYHIIILYAIIKLLQIYVMYIMLHELFFLSAFSHGLMYQLKMLGSARKCSIHVNIYNNNRVSSWLNKNNNGHTWLRVSNSCTNTPPSPADFENHVYSINVYSFFSSKNCYYFQNCCFSIPIIYYMLRRAMFV